MKTKLLSMMLTAVMTMSSLTMAAYAVDYSAEYPDKPTANYSQTFNDVPKSHWGFSYIGAMVQRGVLDGYPDGNFYPDNTVTRAEFAKIMMCVAKRPVYWPSYKYFQDVETDAWYAPYVHSAYPFLSGYVYGEDNRYYMPDEPALREDIAVALVKLKGYDTAGADTSILTTMFTDVSSISLDARKYVAVAVDRGLVSGYDDKTFRGQASITRAEAAAMLWRAYQYGNDNKVFDDEYYDGGNNYYDDDDNTDTSSVRFTPTPEPIKTPRPVKTPEPTEEPTPTPEPTEEPTPTPIPATEKPWEVITIDDAYLDDEMSHDYMTYDSNNNYIYYYDQRKNYINIYDVNNDEVIPYLDCSSLYIIEDTNEVVTEIPPTEKGNYYKNIGILEIEYDNYAERLYVKVIPGRLTDIGGLSDKYVSGGWEHVVLFYIDSNRNISNSYYCGEFNMYGICEQGIIDSSSSNVYKIFDRETYEELYEIPHLNAINSSVMVSSDKWYLLRHVNGDSLALCSYDYQQLVKMRDIGRCEYCAMNSNNFYGWDMDRRIIRCDLNGNLSILVDIDNDIKIKDMRPMKITSYNHSEYKMIVTDDENNIIFADDTHLRVIRRVG